MNINAKIFVTGHRSMVGSALVRKLRSLGFTNLLWMLSTPRAKSFLMPATLMVRPRKLLDISRLNALGWRAATALRQGIAQAYASAPFRA